MRAKQPNDFQSYFRWVSLGIVAISVVSMAAAYVGRGADRSSDVIAGAEGAILVWVIGLVVVVCLLIAAGLLAIRGRVQSAKGILAGVGIGALALAASFFANLAISSS